VLTKSSNIGLCSLFPADFKASKLGLEIFAAGASHVLADAADATGPTPYAMPGGDWKYGRRGLAYHLYIPADASAAAPVPLVLWLHGGTWTSEHPLLERTRCSRRRSHYTYFVVRASCVRASCAAFDKLGRLELYNNSIFFSSQAARPHYLLRPIARRRSNWMGSHVGPRTGSHVLATTPPVSLGIASALLDHVLSTHNASIDRGRLIIAGASSAPMKPPF